MESVIVSDFGVMLGKTSERLVVRGPRPRLEFVEGGPQLFPNGREKSTKSSYRCSASTKSS